MVGALLLMGVTMLLYLCCSCPGFTFYVYTRMWSCAPWRWNTNFYERFMFFYYQNRLLTRERPDAGPEFMPVSDIRPKEELVKYVVPYALNIHVPMKQTEEFGSNSNSLKTVLLRLLEENLAELPITDNFDCFAEGEDPVQFVANQLGSVYPSIYQVWDDKQSDMALTRFCLYGLGAHRLEMEELEGTRYYVVRTNALASLPVRDGFERYGGDAYFDLSWRPVKIVDEGLAPLRCDGHQESVKTRPGEQGWNRAKFRFRSSLSVLVTLADHLYGIHMQAANLFVTALREKVSADHPLRRFMIPFTYMTVTVNSEARNNIVRPGTMAPRCFGFTDDSLHLAFAAAPKLIKSGSEVGPEDGGPIMDRIEYIKYLREKKGIDTEYNRQCLEFALILEKFVVDYMACYYPSHADVVRDPELLALLQQFLHQLHSVTYGQVFQATVGQDSVEAIYKRIVALLVNIMFMVTVGHEQVGAIEVYVQDASWCAFRWVPGATAGTKQAATSTALLMSFTSLQMPKLLGDDWTHLFPKPSGPSHGAKSPEECFRIFQEELQAISKKCDAYNDAAASRPFPECFPLYVVNPKHLETSISV
ncbi:unnamed protein product [Polarella glacialis]|uniref:Lipoxygenase domain-containing protein n=1 Tax=Polarella glacialis TaxID=89957 RepID=A0A813EY18_POLGL|nr:unnamed protein product [Polarella glacialis]